jgi:hypothetical protein
VPGDDGLPKSDEFEDVFFLYLDHPEGEDIGEIPPGMQPDDPWLQSMSGASKATLKLSASFSTSHHFYVFWP